MSVIIEPEILDKIERLEKAGNFSAATLLRGQNEVSLDALLFQSFIPAKYLALLGQHSTFQTHHWNGNSRQERDERTRELMSQLQSLRQRQIDQNKLSFNIDGQEINISQGDLRKIMERRVEELKKRQEALLLSGKNPEELTRVTNLIEAYEPAINETKEGKADSVTKAQIQELMKRDPEFARQVKSGNHSDMHVTMGNRQTAFRSEEFGADERAAFSLKSNFANSVNPPVEPVSDSESPPKLSTKLDKVENTAERLGF